jgi:hypothetical protein
MVVLLACVNASNPESIYVLSAYILRFSNVVMSYLTACKSCSDAGVINAYSGKGVVFGLT